MGDKRRNTSVCATFLYGTSSEAEDFSSNSTPLTGSSTVETATSDSSQQNVAANTTAYPDVADPPSHATIKSKS